MNFVGALMRKHFLLSMLAPIGECLVMDLLIGTRRKIKGFDGPGPMGKGLQEEVFTLNP